MELASRYVFVGLIWLVAAMIEGFWMGLTGAMQYLTLHVGMVLSGGVMGIAFGILFRVWPSVGADRWAFPQSCCGILACSVRRSARSCGPGVGATRSSLPPPWWCSPRRC